MINLISAVSKNGCIGTSNNTIPWSFDRYPADMKWFRKMTAGSAVVMGRLTFESMRSKPLPKRRNIVVSRNLSPTPGIEVASDVASAIEMASKSEQPDTWIIGGSGIYRDSMPFAHKIYLTLIPETIEDNGLIYFPWISPELFKITNFIQLENSNLKVAEYSRI